MKVYEWVNDEKVMSLSYKNKTNGSHPIFTSFNGDSIAASWTPFEVTTIYKKNIRIYLYMQMECQLSLKELERLLNHL